MARELLYILYGYGLQTVMRIREGEDESHDSFGMYRR